MRYPPDLLDEIRSRLPVSRIVERRVKLKRAGREYTRPVTLQDRTDAVLSPSTTTKVFITALQAASMAISSSF